MDDGGKGRLNFAMQRIDPIAHRKFGSLEYVNPEKLIKELLPTIDLIQQGTFGGRERKTVVEKYAGALFAYILTQNNHIHPTISVGMKEDDDYDCVVRAVEPSGKIIFRPVQVKEFSNRDPKNSEIQSEINKLKKYPPDLAVVFWVKRDVKIDLSKLKFSGLNIQQLWFMGESPTNEVMLHGGFTRDLISGLCRIKILKNGKVQTLKRQFKPCQLADNI